MARPAHKKDFILSHRKLSVAEIMKLGEKRGIEMSSAYVSKVLQRNRGDTPEPAQTNGAAAPTNGHAALTNGDAKLRAEFLRFMMRIGTERAQEWLQEWRASIARD
jgi:hypothetical protein